jgi:dihydroorotate dehydrogenase electron transfer subunit
MTEVIASFGATSTQIDAESRVDPPRCGNIAPDIAEHACEVLQNTPVNAEYRHMIVAAPIGAAGAQPGQFFHLACPPGAAGTSFLRRPMSVYGADPLQRTVEFLYKVQGTGTQGLATLQPGDTLDALGPLGCGFALPEGVRHVLLVARGVGLATLAPLAAHAVARGARVTAVLSARSQALVMSADRLRQAGATVHVVTDEDGSSEPARLEAQLEALHAREPFDFLSTCGSNRLLVLLQRLGRAWGVCGQTAIEQHMGCGIGSCYACVRPFREHADSDRLTFRRVCWEGPVFDLQETTSW